ncbi:MAG TPA: hypothetical protein PLD23_07505 [Armatimonadota bacterium]|nr:hypothetical protein [Armatimonadota bacterium]
MRISKGAVAVLVIGIVAVILGTYFAGEIQNFVALRAWSTGAARAAAGRLVEAMKNRDLETVKGLCGPDVKVGEAEGQLTGIGQAGPMAPPPIPIDLLLPSESVDQATISFDIPPPRGTALVTIAGPEGRTIKYHLKPTKGKWLLVGVSSAMTGTAGGGASAASTGPKSSPNSKSNPRPGS